MSVSVSTMRQSDQYTIDNNIATSRELMLRAGIALADLATEIMRDITAPIVVLCGKGNNGGDGYVAANIMSKRGYKLLIYAVDTPTSADCMYYSTNLPIKSTDDFLTFKLHDCVILDCILGTGIKGDVSEKISAVIDKINDSKMNNCIVIAADMPSGLRDNGRAKIAVKADYTLAIGADKDAYYFNDGKDYTGIVRIADIGIIIVGDQNIVTDNSLVAECFKPRLHNTHKGTYGSVAIVACSDNYVGAGKLASLAAENINDIGDTALRSGAGLVKLYVPKALLPHMWGVACSSSLGTHANVLGGVKADAFAYGMGVGEGDTDILRLLISNSKPLVIDADGLNLLARNAELLQCKPKGKIVVISPHVGEMSRLSGLSIEEILNDPIAAARDYSNRYGVVVLLKGTGSVITDGKIVYINSIGSACLAKGGSGDILSGIIAALLAKGIDGVKAAACGAYILGAASIIAAGEWGENSTLPTDVAKAIKCVINR